MLKSMLSGYEALSSLLSKPALEPGVAGGYYYIVVVSLLPPRPGQDIGRSLYASAIRFPLFRPARTRLCLSPFLCQVEPPY